MGSRERKRKPRAIGQNLGNAVKGNKNAWLAAFLLPISTEVVDKV